MGYGQAAAVEGDVTREVEAASIAAPVPQDDFDKEFGANDEFITRPEGHFHTQRAKGKGFVFTAHGDAHMDENSVGDLYKATLLNVLEDEPDFHIDAGDTFMVRSRIHLPRRWVWVIAKLHSCLRRICAV